MNRFSELLSKKNSFTLLLINLSIFLLLFPLSVYGVGELLVAGGFLLTNFFIIKTLKMSKRSLFLLRGLAIIAFSLSMLRARDLPILTDLTSISAFLAYMGFNLLAVRAICSEILSRTKVNLNIINGGICIFLLIGFFWFSLYSIILIIDVDAFRGVNLEGEESFQLLYYSFTTLTTLGYGDIVPVNRFAMILANIQAIVGMMYPAIYIARLVTLYDSK
ncbi:MAG: ion channel [Microcystaceae cyanobacterium]